MMEKLLTPGDVASILSVSKRTAYKLMHGMHRLERPLRVTEESLREWINERAVTPGRKPRKGRALMNEYRIERRKD